MRRFKPDISIYIPQRIIDKQDTLSNLLSFVTYFLLLAFYMDSTLRNL